MSSSGVHIYSKCILWYFVYLTDHDVNLFHVQKPTAAKPVMLQTHLTESEMVFLSNITNIKDVSHNSCRF
jgi:hypothetical protein